MRKLIRITLIDGTTYDRELPAQVLKTVPIGSPPVAYNQFAQVIATNGFLENPEAEVPRWIAPSQVKTVDIVFERPKFEGQTPPMKVS